MIAKKTIPLMLAALHGTAAALCAQQYVARQLPTQSQLPVASVHCILQDSEGYMWYGTSGGGLCRDNGYQVDVWRSGASAARRIGNDYITCVAEDSRQGVWFGTQKGLYRIDKAGYTLEQPVARLGKAYINAICRDRYGRIWVSGSGEIVCVLPDGTRLAYGQAGHPIGRFYDDGTTLWGLQWGGGLLSLSKAGGRNGHWRFTKRKWPGKTCPMVMAKAPGTQGYWVGTWGEGVGYYNPQTGSLSLQPATWGAAEKQQVIDMRIDSSQGLLWTTTMDNLYAYAIHGTTLTAMPTGAFLPPGNKILDGMAEDRDGNLWVAGFTPHTFIISSDNSQTARYAVEPMSRLTGFPLLADRVVADGEDFWIWQGRTGLTHYEPAARKVVPVSGNAYERCIAKRKGGSGIWAASGNRLFLLSSRNGKVEERPISSTGGNISCLRDQGGNRLWIGTESGVYCYATLGGTKRQVAKTKGKVIDLAASADHTLYYIVAGKGLWRQQANARPRRIDRGGEEFSALAMLNGTTLVAATTQGSVYTIGEGDSRLQRDPRMGHTNGDVIKDLETDEMGHLWILSDQYATEINPQNHSFRTFRNTDAFINVSYFYSMEPTGNGMLLNGAGAFCAVRSSQALNGSTSRHTRPLVTSVQIGDSVHLMGPGEQRLLLSSGERTITARVSTLDILHAGSISYAYRLRGLSDQWVYLPQGANSITIANLPKGSYRLEVNATDSHGCWGKPRLCLSIRRMPAWYDTWWAWCIYALAMVAAACGLWALNRRIHWLETLQRKRRELSLSEIELHPDETNKARLDEQFLRRAISQVERHLADTGYSVERFAGDMCMSRMNLYRKIQAQTGLTPSEFVRDIRLKKAARLLLNGPQMPVAEVAGRVGFSSAGYFSRCFKDKFGLLPTEYGRKGRPST